MLRPPILPRADAARLIFKYLTSISLIQYQVNPKVPKTAQSYSMLRVMHCTDLMNPYMVLKLSINLKRMG